MDHDLLIVGGGPAGVSTALFLAHAAPRLRGRIAVIERLRHPREKICAGAIGGRADRALESIGVRVDVPSAFIRGLSVITPAGRLVCRRAEVVGRVVRRVEFDAALADAARDRGIVILEGRRVTGLDRREDGVTVHFEGQGSLHARAVVGADGVGSVVRRELGLGRGALVAQAVEIDTEPTGADPDDDLIHFDATDTSLRGYAWDFPTIVGGRRLCCRGVYELLPERDPGNPSRGRAPDRGPDVSSRLSAYLESRALPSAPARFKRFAERGLSLHEPTARPRVLLVGEAAGIDPVLGEGIAQAILYGQTAGPYLARCIERRAYDFSDWPRTFASSAVGWDLSIRTRLAPWVYGRARRVTERFVARCGPFADAGIHYFAGDRVPRLALLRAALALAREALR
jgi:flavin-dependent dehydrogenase